MMPPRSIKPATHVRWISHLGWIKQPMLPLPRRLRRLLPTMREGGTALAHKACQVHMRSLAVSMPRICSAHKTQGLGRRCAGMLRLPKMRSMTSYGPSRSILASLDAGTGLMEASWPALLAAGMSAAIGFLADEVMHDPGRIDCESWMH